jgi:hypothetical protein
VPMELTIRGSSQYISEGEAHSCNPANLAHCLCSPEAIVFGDGKPQIGCLIHPSALCNGMDREAILDKAWVGIDMANQAAPSHSRIVPELVEILPCDSYLCKLSHFAS